MFSLIVFDLDGTLLDTRQDLADSANELVASFGGRALPDEAVVRMVGEGARALVERAFDAAGLDAPPDEALPRFLEIYDRRLFEHTRPYEGVEEVLRAISSRLPVAVVTNKPERPAAALLEGFGFARYLRRVVGGDSGWPRKPAPDALLALAAEHGAAPRQTLMVGDSRIDHETAANAGTAMCVARYGFGWETFPRRRLTGDEWLIDRPLELLDRLHLCPE